MANEIDYAVRLKPNGFDVGGLDVTVHSIDEMQKLIRLHILFKNHSGLVIWVDEDHNVQIFSESVEWKPSQPLEYSKTIIEEDVNNG